MRYQVGDKIWTVFFHNVQAMFYPHFTSWMPFHFGIDTKQLPRIEFLELTVTEHHKVRWEYDNETDEPKYDGYVLTDKDGKVWHNQYPRANYGQTSDTSDGLFTLHMESERAIFEKTMDYIRARRTAREGGLDVRIPAPHLIQTYDLMRELANINYAAHAMQERAADPKRDEEAVEHLNLLNRWYTKIIETFKAETGLVIESSPVIFGEGDEQITLPGHYRFNARESDEPEVFHVVKSSRAYSGEGYSGPAMQTANITLKTCEFEDQQNAESCARKLTAVNPVGFDVYSSKTRQCVYRARDIN